MKNCDIARDLMPLCADGLASEESEAFVRAHIEECEDCRASFGRMTAGDAEPAAETEKADFKRALSREKRRRRTVALSLALAALILGAALVFAWSEDVFSIIKIDRSPTVRATAVIYGKNTLGGVPDMSGEIGHADTSGFTVVFKGANERAIVFARAEFVSFDWSPNGEYFTVTYIYNGETLQLTERYDGG